MASSRIDSPAVSLKSELILNALWLSSIDGIRVIGDDCRIILVNPAYCGLVNRTEMELIGAPFYDVYTGGIQERIRDQMLAIFRTKIVPVDFERENELWDGTKKWFEISNSLIGTGDGVQYILSIIRDRTTHKENERRVIAAEEHFRALYENAPLSYQSLNADAVILDVNPTWLKTVGFDRDEVVGRKFWDFMTPASAAQTRQFFPEFVRTGEIHNVELELVRKDGRHFFVDYEGKAAYDETGAFRQTHCIFTDISERKRTEEELQKMYLQTRKYAHMKDELLNEVNHRVKNNLMTILGLILAEKRRTRTAKNSAAETLWDDFELRINGLLNVHQMLSDSKWAPLNISDLAWKIVSGVAAVHEPELSVTIDVGQSDIVVSPRQANNLALALNELATNSMKHAFHRTGSPEIAVSFWTEDQMICIEFRDNGSGFPNSVMTAGDENVGLHLVRQLIQETLRGKITYANRNGAVTIMRIRMEETSRT